MGCPPDRRGVQLSRAGGVGYVLPLGTIGEGITVDAAGNVYVGEVSINGMTMLMPTHGGM